MSATIHLIHGFLGFGKTTIARQLAAELPAVLLTNDEFMVKLYGRNPPAEQFGDYFSRVDAIIWDLAEQIINAGTDVILDNGFWAKESRAAAYVRAKKITDNVIFHSIQCDMETARQSVLERNTNPDLMYIDENTFDLFLPQWQPIGPDENYSIVAHDNNIKELGYAAYIIPVREADGKKQVAFVRYKDGWHGKIGGRLNGDETPREALSREICEELGEASVFMARDAVQIPEKYICKIHNIFARRARNEEWTYFITKVSCDTELAFCETDNPGACIKWLDIDSLSDEKIIVFADSREYYSRVIIPAINKL